ncbi:MAG: hypothetical protein KF888_03090 [Nitrosomonas sp.]|nr:hypothetical protein [Nitrosomonas sp.]
MQDYLSQLINRTRQPALAVQPRPISRFESPRHMAIESFDPAGYSKPYESHEESPELFNPLESATARGSDEPEVRFAPSGRFVAGMEADSPVQSNENNHPESGMANTLSGDSPAAESSMTTQVSKPVFTHPLRREIDPVVTDEQPAKLSRQTVRTEQSVPVSRAEPARSVMRQGKNAAEKATMFLNSALSGQSEHTEHITRRRQEPIEPDTGPDIRPDTIVRQPADTSNSISAWILPESVAPPAQERRELHQSSATFSKPATIPDGVPADSLSLSAYPQPAAWNQSPIQTVKASTHSLIPPVRVENPESKPTSPDSAPVTVARRAELVSEVFAQTGPLPERRSDSTVRPRFSAASERAIFKQPFAEPDALQHAAEPVANAPAPTIHVTIGRIEVRAAVAAASTSAAARKVPARSSTMSLDDYLKQRSGRPR